MSPLVARETRMSDYETEGKAMAFTIVETMVSEPASERATEYQVPTRDGAALATDVYLPADATTHSAILIRTPYDKSSRYTALKFEAEYYSSRGYAVVAQDVRGKFRSTGQTVPYAFDVADGYDTVEWITQQSWSNGIVGVTGASYYGFTTWAAVASGHPAIKAAVPQVTGIEMGHAHVGAPWRHRRTRVHLPQRPTADLDRQLGRTSPISIGQPASRRCSRPREKRSASALRPKEHRSSPPLKTGTTPTVLDTRTTPRRFQSCTGRTGMTPALLPSGLRDWRHFRSLPGQRHLHHLRAASADHAGFELEHVGKGEPINPYVSESALAEKIHSECSDVADFFDEHLNGLAPSEPRPRARWHAGNVGWQASEEFPPRSTPLTFHLADTGQHIRGLSRQALTPPKPVDLDARSGQSRSVDD